MGPFEFISHQNSPVRKNYKQDRVLSPIVREEKIKRKHSEPAEFEARHLKKLERS